MAEEPRPISPLEGVSFSSILRRGGKHAEAIARQVAQNYEDFGRQAEGALNVTPPGRLMKAWRDYQSAQRGKEEGEGPSFRPAPFAQPSSDLGVQAGAMALDPANLIGAGVTPKLVAAAGPLARKFVPKVAGEALNLGRTAAVPVTDAANVAKASTITPKVSARGPDLNTEEGVAAFQAKYGRKPVNQMTEAERVQEFGPAMGESPDIPFSDVRSRREMNMPGGFRANVRRGGVGSGLGEKPMTLADQAKISAQAIDYNTLHPDTALAIHKRLMESVDPGAARDTPLELANRLGFGISSGNAPISKNLLEHAMIRPRSEAEMAEWANYSPVGIGEQLPKDVGTALGRDINRAYGVQAKGRGGVGVANTANRQYISDLNKMLLQKPEWFPRGAGEPEAHYAERLMNQVRGLGPKTGSLGVAMLEPQTSNISAIDRHIADLTREAVKRGEATKPIFEQQMLNAFNLAQPERLKAASYTTALRRAGEAAPKIEAEKFREIVSSPQESVYRQARTGEISPEVPAHLQPGKLPFYEPTHVRQIGPLYQAALEQVQQGGAKRGIGGFGNQWYDWDYARSRAEPHAALNPMALRMKRMTSEEYGLVRDEFARMGAFKTNKNPATGRLFPLKPSSDYRKLIYGRTDPAFLATLGLGTVGVGGLAYALRNREQ